MVAGVEVMSETSEDSLRHRIEELEAADRRKNEFLGKLAHDVVNLFLPFQLVLQLLEQPEPDRENLKQTRDLLQEYVPAVSKLLGDLRRLSRLLRGKIEPHRRPFDLDETVCRVQAAVAEREPAGDHQWTVALAGRPVRVEGDPELLRQVVEELLENAVKFTAPGGQIAVELQQEGDEAVLRVRDSGSGIAPEFLPRVFDLFAQQDLFTNGWGVGLGIAQQAVEMHGGRIEAESPGPGQGAEFTVRLPTTRIS